MINDFKSHQHSSAPTPTKEQLPIVSSIPTETYSSEKDPIIQHSQAYISDVYSNLLGNREQTKRYLFEIAQHFRSTIQLLPDGSILVTPRPRSFPNELISLILNHVTNDRQTLYECTLTTKQFYMIAYPLLWQLPITIQDSGALDCFLARIASSPQLYPQPTIGHAIQHLCLDGTHWTDDGLLLLVRRLPFLTFLSVTTRHITDTGFRHILQHCRHLTSLHMAHTRLTELSFSAIGKFGCQLKHLDWHVSTKQSPEWLAMIDDHRWERLQITSDFVRLTQTAMVTIQKFAYLTTLEIKQMPDEDMSFLLQSTATSWPRLTHLILGPCSDLDDRTLLGFLKAHCHLRHLQLSYAGKLTNASLHNIITWLPSLIHLGLVGNANITAGQIRQCIQAGPLSLTSVQLFSCARNVGNQFPESTLSFGTAVNLNRNDIQAIKTSS